MVEATVFYKSLVGLRGYINSDKEQVLNYEVCISLIGLCTW